MSQRGICRTGRTRRRVELGAECAEQLGYQAEGRYWRGAYSDRRPGIASGAGRATTRPMPFPRLLQALEAGLFFDLLARAFERGEKPRATPG